jgi:hypothetical protein
VLLTAEQVAVLIRQQLFHVQNFVSKSTTLNELSHEMGRGYVDTVLATVGPQTMKLECMHANNLPANGTGKKKRKLYMEYLVIS